MRRIRVGLAQMNATVGDFDGNCDKILEAIDQARSLGVDLLTFPELSTCGYPPEDLVFKPRFVQENLRVLDEVVAQSAGIAVVLGFVDVKEDLYNAAAVVHDGRLAGVYHKVYLPNYGVFDENRYFQVGHECPVYVVGGVVVGVTICEDMWYEAGPGTAQAYSGAEVIVNISASPYHAGKGSYRERMLGARAADSVAIVVHTNMVGGQDELVFDGNSLVLDERGRLVARGKQFAEDLVVVDLDAEAAFAARLQDPRWRKAMPLVQEQRWRGTKVVVTDSVIAGQKPPLPETHVYQHGLIGEVYEALVLGTHDYVTKNGFEKVVIGLSGGIDSALVATIAVDALGPGNVVGVSMPSRYSSQGSVGDCELLARNLGIRLMKIPIDGVFQAFLDLLAGPFEGTEPNVAEENIQARIRGGILMALSNKFGWLVLTTGNKSEMATGYCTLYGDMAGGFAVIKDVPKTMVYDLARYRNASARRDLIPASIIEKMPSAELKPDQKDADFLPPYEILDAVLMAYVEEDRSVDDIVAMGIDGDAVRKAARLVDTSEYKRRQAPPGVKITARAFGRDRRLPITSRFRGR